MKKVISILVTLVFILSALVPLISADDLVDGVYVYEEDIDDDGLYFDQYWIDADFTDGGFGWTHTIDPECKNMLEATLVIGANDVDYYDPWWQTDLVYADGVLLGMLTGAGNEEDVESTFDIDPELLADGELEIWLDIDTTDIGSRVMIEYSELTVEWVPCLKIKKELVGGPEFVPLQTHAEWDLKITVENPADAYGDGFTGVWIYDGIGAKLDLVIQNDGGGDYIFKIDSNPILLGGNGDQYNGEDATNGLYWRQANGKPVSEKKRCATNLTWGVGGLDDGDDPVTLEFRVETYEYTVGGKDGKKNPKHAFTSTCHHELNDGPIAAYMFEGNYYFAFGEPVYVSVYDPDPEADSDGDGYPDIDEVDCYHTDPCDPNDYPVYVLWDDTHDLNGDSLYTDYFSLYENLTSDRYYIDQLEDDEGPIDESTLADYDILVIPDAEDDLSNAEITAIQNFVSSGGGLFVLGEIPSEIPIAIHNTLLAPYSIQFTETSPDSGTVIKNNLTAHQITTGITSFYYQYGSFLDVSSPAITLATYDDKPILAAWSGTGKVVVIGDSNLFEDLWLQLDNQQLGINIMDWLS